MSCLFFHFILECTLISFISITAIKINKGFSFVKGKQNQSPIQRVQQANGGLTWALNSGFSEIEV